MKQDSRKSEGSSTTETKKDKEKEKEKPSLGPIVARIQLQLATYPAEIESHLEAMELEEENMEPNREYDSDDLEEK